MPNSPLASGIGAGSDLDERAVLPSLDDLADHRDFPEARDRVAHQLLRKPEEEPSRRLRVEEELELPAE